MSDNENFEYSIDNIKRKVKKLLALSKSANENEAVAALKKANESIAKFGFNSDEFSDYMSQKIKTTIRDSNWRFILANAVENLYATYHYKDRFGNFVFYGEELDVFMSSEMYCYLENTVNRMAAHNIRKNAKYRFRQSYRVGIARRLYDRMLELGQQCSWRNLHDMKKKQKEIQKIVENQISLEVVKMKPDRLNTIALSRGLKDGDNINLNRQMPEVKIQRINA